MADDVLALLARALVPYLKAELVGSADRFDLATSPAGKRRAFAAARAGQIKDAQRIGRRWFCSPAEHAVWLESIAVRPNAVTMSESSVTPNSVDALRDKLGLRLVGGRTR